MLALMRGEVITLTNETLLTTEQAAARLGVSIKTVTNYVNSGSLQAVPTMYGKRRVLRFAPETIDAFIEQQRQQLTGDAG